VGFKFCTFFGGFKHKLTGFEESVEVHRVLKIWPGAVWASHRPPKIQNVPITVSWPERHLDFETLAAKGIRMYHYSYVFPRQVREKVSYYKEFVNKNGTIDDYFNRVWLPWVRGDSNTKASIENEFDGVHEFLPSKRGPCRTEEFKGTHPDVILRDMTLFQEKFDHQLKECL
jgi:hypothetical protein